MMSGIARQLQAADPRPLQVFRDGRPHWHAIWDHNPRFLQPGTTGPFQRYDLGPKTGRRPYMDPARSTKQRWVWTDWRAPPGEIYLADAERRFAAGHAGAPFVVIEPNIKAKASPNKDWGFARYQEVVRRLPLLRFVQFTGGRMLDGVTSIQAPDFRHAAAVLARARAFIGPEGALHHAAAALNVKAVVIFGGYIAPATTGYDLHTNLFTGGQACGQRVPCPHCHAALAAITPETVARELETILEPLHAA